MAGSGGWSEPVRVASHGLLGYVQASGSLSGSAGPLEEEGSGYRHSIVRTGIRYLVPAVGVFPRQPIGLDSVDGDLVQAAA